MLKQPFPSFSSAFPPAARYAKLLCLFSQVLQVFQPAPRGWNLHGWFQVLPHSRCSLTFFWSNAPFSKIPVLFNLDLLFFWFLVCRSFAPFTQWTLFGDALFPLSTPTWGAGEYRYLRVGKWRNWPNLGGGHIYLEFRVGVITIYLWKNLKKSNSRQKQRNPTSNLHRSKIQYPNMSQKSGSDWDAFQVLKRKGVFDPSGVDVWK